MASTGGTQYRSNLEGLDGPALMRSASTGFTILIIGGFLAGPASKVPGIGAYWVTLTSLVAFIVAGAKIGRTHRPYLQGAISALAAYVLAVPLVAMTHFALDIQQLFATSCTAIGAGATAGALSHFGQTRLKTPRKATVGQRSVEKERREL